MLRLATLMVGSTAIGEEIVHDAFASVGERWSSLERPGGYLRTCVVNGCRQVLRRRPLQAKAARLGQADRTTAALPDHLVELQEALDTLSDPQRMVIVLRYFVDIADGEIAELLDMPASTVRSHARRALTALRTELDDTQEDSS